ncbi:MAG: class I SAM-dependent methyltransferase [Fibrobacteria bacterium]|nr:class I SAM-dependent methyltransferase [Fibrobacteria bacterium]
MTLYQTIYNKALKLKEGTEHLTYGRAIVRNWALGHTSQFDELPKILDIGCGKGDDLSGIGEALGRKCELHAIEYYDEYRKLCEEKGIQAKEVNIERDVYPWEDNFFDLVIANQIIEHTKDTFYMISEISRILKPDGSLIIGIPNLAAWHDRLILLLGQQPSGMKMLGPHPRGITRPALKQFMECDGFFELIDFKGSGFYPFPESVANILARLFPSLATSTFFLFKRTKKPGTFIEVLKSRFFETNYYQGS